MPLIISKSDSFSTVRSIMNFIFSSSFGFPFGITSRQGKRYELIRPLLEKGNNTFICFNEAISILRKILVSENENFSKLVSSCKPFGIATDVQLSQQQIDSIKYMLTLKMVLLDVMK